ncbi:hypothetical protein Syun_004207 [Stephania yunnanensis]|uniref:Uncharacterized protein n=1 Tax=Stephania yunnanensis TaxID=152371 RepID=A0AAP0L551_9MAGN
MVKEKKVGGSVFDLFSFILFYSHKTYRYILKVDREKKETERYERKGRKEIEPGRLFL